MKVAIAVICAIAAVGSATAASGNMNGKYSVATGAGKQDAPWNDDYASKGYEYFDVYAPEIATHYGEVFWTDQGNQPLPDAIIKRFAGKTMAIVGYEQDQVMVNPVGKPGVNPSEDVSVPINWAYNHHYMAWMTGTHSYMEQVEANPNDVSAHGAPFEWVAKDLPSAANRADTSIPTNQMFSEGNGGESRKSYHGYPKGFAQLIDSPTQWHITPMQIDTRNRDCGVTPADIHNCTQFIPGPEPKQSRYGRGIPTGTNYSGILECPCNTRYGGDPGVYPGTKTKDIVHFYSVVPTGVCPSGENVGTSEACFGSVPLLGLNATSFVNKSVSDSSLPTGCSVEVTNGVATVTFNSIASTTKPNVPTALVGQTTTTIGTTLGLSLKQDGFTFDRSPKGQWCSKNHADVLAKFRSKSSSTADDQVALAACESFCLSSSVCTACSVDLVDPKEGISQWVAIPSCGTVESWAGAIVGDISRKVSSGNVTITVSGPADAWFGVGFNAVEMSDSPYTLIINSTGVIEQKIGTCGSEAEHCPGTQLQSSVHVISTSTSGNVRTVVMTRAMVGITKDHYTFSMTNSGTINIISAVGVSQVFAYHKAHVSTAISVMEAGKSNQVCDLGADGKLCDTNGTSCNTFVKDCVPAPDGDLLTQDNPTCNSRQYAGGLRCCGHKRIMLDDDQEIRPELLRYHMKFRFWFQEYVPATTTQNASHYNLERVYYQTEAHAGEYDIPPAFRRSTEVIPGYDNWPMNKPTPGTHCTGSCPDGPDCECIHEIRFNWTMSNVRLLYAGGHCHAPACISMELWMNATGTPELLCAQIPKFGTGNVTHDKYDEAGYIALPPCLWGDDEGLAPSVLIPENTPMFSIKKNRNTHTGHYGEMASWQMRGVNF